MTRQPWTDTERDQLRALYPDHSAQECAYAIGRSVLRSTCRRMHLGCASRLIGSPSARAIRLYGLTTAVV